MKVRGLGAAAVIVVSMVGPLAPPAGAATSQGCSGSISSVDSQGAPLEKISVPGPGGSNANPFQLYWGLPLTWTGQSTQAVTSGTWRVKVQHPSWLFGLGELVLGHKDGLAGTFDSAQGGTSFTRFVHPELPRAGHSPREVRRRLHGDRSRRCRLHRRDVGASDGQSPSQSALVAGLPLDSRRTGDAAGARPLQVDQARICPRERTGGGR